MKNWEKVPQEVKEAIAYDVARCGDDYDDNHRAYRYKDNYLKSEFMEAERQGCCGTGHGHCIDDNGDKWIIGWNHGH